MAPEIVELSEAEWVATLPNVVGGRNRLRSCILVEPRTRMPMHCLSDETVSKFGTALEAVEIIVG